MADLIGLNIFEKDIIAWQMFLSEKSFDLKTFDLGEGIAMEGHNTTVFLHRVQLGYGIESVQGQTMRFLTSVLSFASHEGMFPKVMVRTPFL